MGPVVKGTVVRPVVKGPMTPAAVVHYSEYFFRERFYRGAVKYRSEVDKKTKGPSTKIVRKISVIL